MRYFAGLIFLFAIFFVAIMVARFSQRERLPRNERKELIASRNLIDELAVSASEHAVLGDDYATIVLDEIRKHRREVQ